ncbi:MAG: pyruvate kinase [Thermoanaerobaculia bacterium]
MKRSKILATISPKTVRTILRLGEDSQLSALQVGHALEQLAQAGVDAFRLNMSFRRQMGDRFIEQVFAWFRKEKNRKARWVTVLVDLQGPKIRLGDLKSTEQPHPTPGAIDLRPPGLQIYPGEEFKLFYRSDKKRGISAASLGDRSHATVLLNEALFEQFGQLVRAGLRAGDGDGSEGLELHLGDGEPSFRVSTPNDVRRSHIRCTVVLGGTLVGGRGIMPKRIPLDIAPITDKDRRDLHFLLEVGAEFISYVALSFVKSPLEILELKRMIQGKKSIRTLTEKLLPVARERTRSARTRFSPHVIAKIETVQAVEPGNIEAIIDVADGVMVARGDLGLQLDVEAVPTKQKEIIKLCNLRGKPVITATQMLDSMEKAPRPKRPEVADVFNAVMDGTDALMLSGETSQGDFPLESIRMMERIIQSAETYYFSQPRNVIADWQQLDRELADIVGAASARRSRTRSRFDSKSMDEPLRKFVAQFYRDKEIKSQRQSVTDRISLSAWVLSEVPEVQAILAASTSGRTARMISRFRPFLPVIGATHDEVNRRKLILSYGIIPINVGPAFTSTERLHQACVRRLKAGGFLTAAGSTEKGDQLIFVLGTPQGEPGTTNQIQLRSLGNLRWTKWRVRPET